MAPSWADEDLESSLVTNLCPPDRRDGDPFTNVCPNFRQTGEVQRAFLKSVSSLLRRTSTQNNHYVKAAYFGVAYSGVPYSVTFQHWTQYVRNNEQNVMNNK